ncbi:hypothetical protein [Bacillus sp. FSL K6-3431]|uniref:hypothetical protein n=1 Tax=Bacillus sp. FSL K6-3431 TaxID=2921500 RepID=UPI0030F995E4
MHNCLYKAAYSGSQAWYYVLFNADFYYAAEKNWFKAKNRFTKGIKSDIHRRCNHAHP